MKTTSTTSDSGSRGDGSAWPVLARLPDVSDQLPNMAPPANRAAAAGFVSYRFDPPENAERGVRSVEKAAQRVGKSIEPRPGQPHMMQNAARTRARGESPILPRSNPFAIPRTSLHDSLAPVARFLVIFALATAVGTSVLTIRRHAEPVDNAAEPATTAAHQSLEPHTAPTAAHVIESPASPPTAAGPLGTKTPRTGLRTKDRHRSSNQNPQSAVAPAAPRNALSHWRLVPQVQTSDDSVAGGSADPARVVTEGLPRVSAAEPAVGEVARSRDRPQPLGDRPQSPGDRPRPPVDRSQQGDPQQAASASDSAASPVMARLPGYILASPTQQAHHDDNESSLH